jgi:hypothetical protein
MELKYDQGKIRMALVTAQFRPALVEVAKVLTFGAQKYPHPESGDRSWRKISNGVSRYLDAFERHMNEVYAEAEGLQYTPMDSESGLRHIDHAITNLLFIRTLLEDQRRNECIHPPTNQ